jgi:N6-L-threonylcarbamoyladenine synthase
MVYVLNQNGQPLMPTENHRMVRLLLKTQRAKVVRRTPFTIKLLVKTKEFVQSVALGVDAGSKTIGLSASNETKELFAAELKPRNDVVNNLSTRREFRRARRNRKTRYRKERRDNRVHSKHNDWLAPSVEVKIHEHVTAIKRICKILPVAKVIVETAEFDLQLIKAVEAGLPVPIGEDYQKGEQLGFYNVRQYVFHRDGYRCCHCGSHGDGVKFETHHLESRKTGGNAPDNLITLCGHCHELVTNDAILGFNKRKRKSTRDATFMGIMRKTFMERLRKELPIAVFETKGYITKCVRETHKLSKSHTIDALCIAGHPNAKRLDKTYLIKPVRNHNRQLHKATILKGGVRKANQAATYVKGFRLLIRCFITAKNVLFGDVEQAEACCFA